jgi:hypothetical protein
LNSHFEEEYYPEIFVVEEGLKYIKFTIDNDSRVDHVDNIHQNEGMEDDCILNKFVGIITVLISWFSLDNIECFFKEDHLSEEHEDDHD